MAGLAALTMVPRTAFSSCLADADQDGRVLNRLKDLISSRASALAIGMAVLKSADGKGSRRQHLRALLKQNRQRYSCARSKQELAVQFRSAVLRDFDDGRTVNVDGLVLASTEANLCALIVLDAMAARPGSK